MKITTYASNKLSSALLEANLITPEEQPYYSYSYSYIFEMIFFISSILLLGLITNTLDICILFSIVMMPARIFAGGFHAEKEETCTILSYLMIIGTILVGKYYPFTFSYFTAIIFLIETIFILSLCPIDTYKKRFSREQKKKLKRKTCFCYVFVLFLFFAFFYKKYARYCGILTLCNTIACISLIAGYIKNKIYIYKEVNHD